MKRSIIYWEVSSVIFVSKGHDTLWEFIHELSFTISFIFTCKKILCVLNMSESFSTSVLPRTFVITYFTPMALCLNDFYLPQKLVLYEKHLVDIDNHVSDLVLTSRNSRSQFVIILKPLFRNTFWALSLAQIYSPNLIFLSFLAPAFVFFGGAGRFRHLKYNLSKTHHLQWTVLSVLTNA